MEILSACACRTCDTNYWLIDHAGGTITRVSQSGGRGSRSKQTGCVGGASDLRGTHSRLVLALTALVMLPKIFPVKRNKAVKRLDKWEVA